MASQPSAPGGCPGPMPTSGYKQAFHNYLFGVRFYGKSGIRNPFSPADATEPAGHRRQLPCHRKQPAGPSVGDVSFVFRAFRYDPDGPEIQGRLAGKLED